MRSTVKPLKRAGKTLTRGRSCDCRAYGSDPPLAKVPEIRVFADLLGIKRYFACSMPSSTTQPISTYREPVHFPLMTNGRCVVANEISSSENEGSELWPAACEMAL